MVIIQNHIRDPCPCRPRKKTLYWVLCGSSWFNSAIFDLKVAQWLGDLSKRPNRGGIYMQQLAADQILRLYEICVCEFDLVIADRLDNSNVERLLESLLQPWTSIHLPIRAGVSHKKSTYSADWFGCTCGIVLTKETWDSLVMISA